MHITIVKKNGDEFKVRVADNARPVTSAWLGALTQKVCGLLAFESEHNLITLMPPMAMLPLRTENTDRPFVTENI